MSHALTSDEALRYSRQTLLPEIGVLLAWTLLSFFLAVRLFRWKPAGS